MSDGGRIDKLSRRRLLGAAGALGAGLLLRGGAGPTRAEALSRAAGLRHLVWVWQFSVDAPPNLIAAVLRDYGLGILLKTHDGVEWMSQYDKSQFAVSGPPQVGVLASFYEGVGVPFNAWAVVKGINPVREAQMAAEVLGAGARSIVLDLEPHSGFWVGTQADAVTFGRELRRLQPDAWLTTSLDARPWMLERVPLREFVAFSNELAPQHYWRTFNTSANYTRFEASGFPVGPAGVTPEFLNDVSRTLLSGFGLPITPVGQGAGADPAEWRRFIENAFALGSQAVSVWRYGVANADLWRLLTELPPKQPKPPEQIYVVQSGDTLFAIASRFGVSVDEIVQLNGLADPNYLYIGQELRIPGEGSVVAAAAPVQAAPAQQTQTASQEYVVQPGDTLSAIAGRFGTTVDAIARLNGIADPNFISVGQVLRIP